ncbi:MAG: cupin domain-containing protein [Victivallales bacterium]|nr:cupin domain-containing protein [Victivallales bacterium]
MADRDSIFARIPEHLPEELFERLGGNDRVRIERIVSDGHASPPGFWYDQEQTEWVMVLAGSAVLRCGEDEPVTLRPGDWLELPPHCRHRVERTAPRTVWLAIHYR